MTLHEDKQSTFFYTNWKLYSLFQDFVSLILIPLDLGLVIFKDNLL